MGLFNKKKIKNAAIDLAKDEAKDQIRDAVEEKVREAAVNKSLDYAMENAGASFLPWWVTFLWWPIKQILLLITWPVRILFKKKKKR
jgi:hypothetical protein